MNHSRSSKRTPLLIVAVLLVPLIAVGLYISSRTAEEIPSAREEVVLERRAIESQVGGVPRPTSDTAEAQPRPEPSGFAAMVGTAPKLDSNSSKAARSITEAVQEKKHMGRLNPVMAPDEFDLAAYKRDPAAYLEIHEPARVWQTAQPGDGVPVLKPVTAQRHRLKQGESVRLQVKTAPEMPVTFTSFDLGLFANGLTSISVSADAKGVAEAEFYGSSGTMGEVNVLAGSPAAAEHVRFVVFVQPPRPNRQ